jgi:hypothetical protein
LGTANALAFDATNLATVNTVDLLPQLTKSVVIHGFEFSKALDHNLKSCSSLGVHTNVVHFTPDKITMYRWAHRSYQPWGTKLSLQCRQCGALNPWGAVPYKNNNSQGYRIECRNGDCGKVDGRTEKEPWAFQVERPKDSELIVVNKAASSGWLKLAPV